MDFYAQMPGEKRQERSEDVAKEKQPPLEEAASSVRSGGSAPAAERERPHSEEPRRRRDSSARSFSEQAYRFCYWVGIQLMRRWRRTVKRLRRGFLLLFWNLKRLLIVSGEKIKKSVKEGFDAIWAPGKKAKALFRQAAENVRNAPRRDGEFFWKTVVYEFSYPLSKVARVFVRAANWVLPLVGAAVLLYTIQYYNSLQYGLAVEYNGKMIGYIENEKVFDEAQAQVRGRIIRENYLEPEENVPVFTIEAIREDQLTDLATLTDEIIASSGNELQEADGLYVNNLFMGALDPEDDIIALLQSLLDAQSTGAENETVEFVDSVRVVRGLFPVTSVTEEDDLRAALTREVQAQRNYTVQEGDTPWDIAIATDVPLDSLIALNPQITDSLLIGDQLVISKAEPFLGTKIVRTEVYEEEIAYGTIRTEDSSQLQGWSSITKEGVPGIREVTDEVTIINGLEVSRETRSTRVIQEPVSQEVTVGTKRPIQYIEEVTGGQVGEFINPVPGGYVSCAYWGYYNHTGMDITRSGALGTPIIASASGTVVAAGWGGAYGYYVRINHGGGVQTMYAHCNALYVSAGEYVEQGQTIAAIGRTGRASGPHCHFEIIVNGSFQNPANYISVY